MGDILDEAYAIAQCKDCPWYKSCISPMRFTAEDIRRQLEYQPREQASPHRPTSVWKASFPVWHPPPRTPCWRAALSLSTACAPVPSLPSG